MPQQHVPACPGCGFVERVKATDVPGLFLCAACDRHITTREPAEAEPEQLAFPLRAGPLGLPGWREELDGAPDAPIRAGTAIAPAAPATLTPDASAKLPTTAISGESAHVATASPAYSRIIDEVLAGARTDVG